MFLQVSVQYLKLVNVKVYFLTMPDLIESGQKDKEVAIKYLDTEHDVMRYESIGQINSEKSFYEDKEVVALEGSGENF